ncbi:MAG: FtsQ-type POTRA domain-containing protein [Acidobacteria bacterium]|nr:FtsQ-type POTRA domain-containing protein [Acidobacteriota bacterium]
MPRRQTAQGTRRVPSATRDPRLLRARDGGHRRGGAWRTYAPDVLRVGAIVALLLGSGWYVQDVMTSSRAFAVRELKVIGAQRLSEGEVEALLDGLKGHNIVTTPLETWREKLLASPWVREASLRRALPGTIEVRIVERLPMVIARAGDALLLVDELGAIVDEFGPRYGAIDLPIVEGLAAGRAGDGPFDQARVALVAAAVASLRDASLLDRVSQIDVSDARDLAVMLMGDPAVLHLGRERFAERVQAYLEMGDRLTRMVDQVASVDLRFGDRVYVRPRKPGVTFASMPQVTDVGTVEEALAEPDDDDGQQ